MKFSIIGNKYLNILTSKDTYELRVDLTDTSNKKTYALYKTFVVGDDSSKYKLTIGNHSGTAGKKLVINRTIENQKGLFKKGEIRQN